MKKEKKIKIFLLIAYAIIFSLFIYLLFSNFSLNELTTFDFIKNNRDYLIEIKKNNYFFVSAVFFISTIVWVFLLGFGAPIFLLGGFIFGKWFGTLIVVFSLTTGATILYIFANYFLKNYVEEKFSKKFINFKDKFRKNEFFYFLVFRFIGGIPFSISNIIPTLFNIKLKNFFFGTLIGITPQIFFGVTLGSGLEKIVEKQQVAPSFFEILSSPEVYYPLTILIILIIIAIILRKIIFKK